MAFALTPPGQKEAADSKQALDAYNENFENKFEFSPVIVGGRDGKLAKELCKIWGLTIILDLLVEFFETTDPQVVQSQYRFVDFYRLAQHLRLGGNRTDRTTVANADAVARATGER